MACKPRDSGDAVGEDLDVALGGPLESDVGAHIGIFTLYAHAINPITGYPVQKDILSATIIAHQCMLADAYATAFMTLGSRKARQL